MNDLEMTRLCADAMELKARTVKDGTWDGPGAPDYPHDGVYLYDEGSNLWGRTYSPLWDDAQALALVKSETLDVTWGPGEQRWRVGQFRFGTEKGMTGKDGLFCEVRNTNLNRAIVECVAKLQSA